MSKYACAPASVLLALFVLSPAMLPAQVQVAAKAAATSKAQSVLDQAAQSGKYTFVLFYKQNDPATAAMNQTLHDTLAKEANRAVITFVHVADPAEQTLVAKYDVSRAPMPITVAIAPNGALTGMFPQQVKAENLSEAFVTPTMMAAMKALQEGKLVLVSVQGTGKPVAAPAIRELQADPHFSARTVALTTQASDPREAMLMGQMEIDPRTAVSYTALLAPPGILVGKFDVNATKDQVAAALAQAGKCCDDPNCKHNHAATQAAPAKATGTRK